MPNVFFTVWVVGLALLASVVKAQPAPVGRFLSDTVQIGQPVAYTLAFQHPIGLEFVFPDEKYDFSPFELLEKKAFPTRSDSTTSYDTIVYILATFEMEPVQRLAVPVVLTDGKKESLLFPEPAAVTLALVAAIETDGQELMENTSMAKVKATVNYGLIVVVAVLLLFVAAGVYFLFGKKIKDALLLKKMRREQTRFLAEFEQLIAAARQDTAAVERALSRWKIYTGSLLNVPLASLTSKEILATLAEENLYASLRVLDRAIYADVYDQHIAGQLEALKSYAQVVYEQKVKEVANA
jgi:hypothetical protein